MIKSHTLCDIIPFYELLILYVIEFLFVGEEPLLINKSYWQDIDYMAMTYIPKWLGILNTFRTFYYEEILSFKHKIEELNLEFA